MTPRKRTEKGRDGYKGEGEIDKEDESDLERTSELDDDAHELAHTGCQPRKACHADHAVAGRDRSVTVLEE